ncbi:FKBP-type peptidyl-prolyl cis-trans isomerase [Rathayibacter sp. CAU 1779]
MRTLLPRTAMNRTASDRPASDRSGAGRSVPARRIGVALSATALVALALTGCSASSSSSCVQPGDASALVRSSATPTASTGSFPKPLHADSLQKSTIKAGSGDQITDGQPVVITLGIFNGADGKALSTPESGLISASASGGTIPGVQKALLCSQAGSRIVVTGTVGQILGSQQQSGLPSSTTVVAVTNVTKAFLARANGAPRPAQPGMPTVVLAPNGQPGIKIPSHDAPTTLKTAVLKQGSGAELKKNESAVVNYTAVTWSAPDTVASSSWTDGSATVWPASDGSVPTKVTDQLAGQRVGSQLIIVTPGSNATAYVVDILGVAK